MKEILFGIFRKLSIRNLLYKAKIILDRFRGLDFEVEIQAEEFGYDPKNVDCTSPSGNHYLVQVMHDLNITDKDSIVDVGSGKGSAMRSMLKFPFARVDGVEFSEHIANIAIRNFEKLNVERSAVFICDASTFQHFARYNYIYFYNPFPSEIMVRVMRKINRSIQRTDRKIIIIYNNPIYHEIIIGKKVFSRIAIYPAEWGHQMYIYSNRKGKDSRINR